MVITIEKIPYEVTGIIGQGAASVVYLAKQIKGKKSVAIKNIRNYKDPIMKEAVNAEIKIQSSFKNCPFVIQYLGVE
jgi:serine/threonine protein kinase